MQNIIDPKKTGKVDKHLLGLAFATYINRFYEDPNNKKRYEEWQKERTKKT